MIKAFFLDSAKRHISPLLINPGQFLQTLYTNLNCSCVTVIPSFAEELTVWVDEEGFYNNHRGVFQMVAAVGGDMSVGNAVITGPTDEEGNETDCLLSIEEVAEFFQSARNGHDLRKVQPCPP